MAEAGFPTVRLHIDSHATDDLASILDRFPVLGSQLDDEPSGVLAVTVYLASDRSGDIPDLVGALRAIALDDPEVSELAADDWLRRYRETCRPFPVGSTWWIDPDPRRPTPAPDGRSRIALEPRFAFGSGSHESTQLLLLHLEAMDLVGARVLDVGTGSGVLAFAAEHRGADSVVAFDIDPDAVVVAGACADDQDVARPRMFAGTLGSLSTHARFDLILCNMIAAEFLPMARELGRHAAPGGRLLFSGILKDQVVWLTERLRENGLVASLGFSAGEWISMECVVHGP